MIVFAILNRNGRKGLIKWVYTIKALMPQFSELFYFLQLSIIDIRGCNYVTGYEQAVS